MKQALGWHWPDNERHLLDWMVNPKGAMTLNGRAAYQGKKQAAALALCSTQADRRRRAIDVGAHVGLWSFNLARWFNCVEAFEPVALHRECFILNVDPPSPDNFAAPVTLHACALGDRETMVAIHTADSSSGDSWLKGKGDVPMRTLDSFEFTEVDFIKIDCEGYEEFVLHGAAGTIAAWRPVVCVEQKRDMATKFGLKPMGAVKHLIDHHGYKVAQELGGDYLCVPK